MPDINLPAISPLSERLAADIQRDIDQKTKPIGALGQLERLAKQVGLIQNTSAPVVDGCELLIFAADHGIASAGVSAYPSEVTQQMVLNFLNGGAAANVFSTQHGVALRVIDAGVAGEPLQHPDLVSRRIGSGTRSFLEEPAMSDTEVARAIEQGIELGQASPFLFAAFGEMGIGNTSSAAMIAHKLLGKPLDQLVGRGTGLDDKGLEHKLSILKSCSKRTDTPLTPLQCLQEYGGFEISMMVGAMIGAASKGKALLIDGYIATAAMLVANALVPDIRGSGIRDYAIFCHSSAESGHAVMLEALNADPLLDLELRLGEGTGALLAWPLVQSSVAMLRDMASFESAGVSGKS